MSKVQSVLQAVWPNVLGVKRCSTLTASLSVLAHARQCSPKDACRALQPHLQPSRPIAADSALPDAYHVLHRMLHGACCAMVQTAPTAAPAL